MSRSDMFGNDPSEGYNFDPSQYSSSGGSNSASNSKMPWQNQMFGAGASGLGAGLAGLFGHSKNPADAANQYLNQISGVNQQYLNPYNQMGQQAGQNLQGQYSNLLNNPGGELNQIGQSFHQSPGFQFALNQAMAGANRGAAAGGLAGSSSNQLQNMGTATQMGNQDYYNYLNQATNLYGQGLQGEQGLYGVGAGAAGNMADNMSTALSQQAQNAYNGQAGKNAAQSNNWSNIAGGLGAVFSAFM